MEGDIKTLEKVQERLVKLLSDVRGRTYEEKLRDAGLTTLAERRTRGDAIETFKTLKGFNRVIQGDWFSIVGAEARATRSTTSVSEEGVATASGEGKPRNSSKLFHDQSSQNVECSAG